ncbi:hypothetical protein NEOLI_005090 [Neolecta irregularis DAH-3]|uniref:Uncharacterized protein n=1 Tax=Neolecta irregularis (strain DAH-3) TaxID=1198029 RepID=A0A1U7LK15_NEOID|nr:hypothetical protein NEOLI_005090 [Neolecta irregularis DAH-3]|eukprot:OLL23006.1 hypothetical protein NEOLI_005090 [Neolecta irregularis DAH-3]
MIWDPQIYWEDLDISFSFTEPLPPWLSWSPLSRSLHGVPPPAEEGSETLLAITAEYITFGIHHTLSAKVPLDCCPPSDADPEDASPDEDVEDEDFSSDTRVQPFAMSQNWGPNSMPLTPMLSPMGSQYLSPTFVHPQAAFFTPPLTAKNTAFDEHHLGELASPFMPNRHE